QGVAEFRHGEPQRHLPAQYAAVARLPATLAGDDEHESRAIVLGAAQKARERRMCLRLGHAVQIETSIDLYAAAREPLPLAPRQRSAAAASPPPVLAVAAEAASAFPLPPDRSRAG